MAEKRYTGKVKWFSDTKGFGFIAPDDGGEELFVHQSALKCDGYRTVSDGDTVEFQIAFSDDSKTKAVDVTGPNGGPIQSNRKNGGVRVDRRTGGFGGGSGGCYTCGDTGHMARDCSNRRVVSGGRGGEGCFNCGEAGHLARDCVRRGGAVVSRGGGSECYNCGGVGHMARSCPSGNISGGGGRGGGGECFKCGEVGHLARDCFAAGSAGGGGGGSGCYNCGEVGHMARDCLMASERASGGVRRGGGGRSACYHCGVEGHFAKECPNEVPV